MRILIRTTGVRWLTSVLIALALVCAPALTKGSPPVRATAAPRATVTPLALYNSHLNREVFGFVNWQNLGNSSVGYQSGGR